MITIYYDSSIIVYLVMYMNTINSRVVIFYDSRARGEMNSTGERSMHVRFVWFCLVLFFGRKAEKRPISYLNFICILPFARVFSKLEGQVGVR